MRALVCEAFGPIESLAVAERPDPTPGPGEICVDVKAAGLNFPDVLCVQGLYQFKPETPFVPGQEAAGIVSAVGSGVERPRVGDRVAFLTLTGAFGEKALIPAASAIPVPDSMDFETAAAFTMAYGTSYYALKNRAGLQPGEIALVLGAAGGVGLAAVALAKAMGARVIAAASSAAKLEIAEASGADAVINYAEEDLKARTRALAQELAGADGVDVVYDPVGGPYAEPALRALRWEGRYLVVGFAAGDIPKIPLNLTLLKSCQIVGVFFGAWGMRDPQGMATNMAELQALFADGRVRPVISNRYALADATAGFHALAAREAVGKLVITMD